MGFLRRNQTQFTIYRPTSRIDDHGDETIVFGNGAAGNFWGNLQPMTARQKPEEYGITLQYAVCIIASADTDVQEGDRVYCFNRKFDVKAIERWLGHVRLLAQEVFDHE